MMRTTDPLESNETTIYLQDNAKHRKPGNRCENLGKHIENIGKFGVPVIVGINDYVTDTNEEHEVIVNFCKNAGVQCKISSHWEKGGEGAVELAEEVAKIADANISEFHTLYPDEMSLWDKTEHIAKNTLTKMRTLDKNINLDRF